MGRPRGFSRARNGTVRMRFDADESAVLLSLAHQMADFVAPEALATDADPLVALVGIDPAARPPDDPALARLVPDAFTDDPEASAEFRRYTERDLRAAKAAHAALVASTLEEGREDLTAEQVSAWLGFLNDTRLTLGTRLGVTDDGIDVGGMGEGDPRLGLAHVYDWLTYLQDSLVQLLLPRA